MPYGQVKNRAAAGQLLAQLEQGLEKAPEVAFAYLFGSALKGENFHDIDIAVYLLPCPSSTYERFRLAMCIGRLIERSLRPRHEVDIRVLNEAPLSFCYEVVRTGRLVFSRSEEVRVDYEASLFSEYLDYRSVWAVFIQNYLGDGRMEPIKLLQHLQEMDEALADWERYQKKVTLEQMQDDRDTRNMVLHAMLVSIQASIDIADHIIAKKGLRAPATYRETFEILAEASVIPGELAEGLADLAGFRNVLVHIYWRLDVRRAFEILQEGAPLLRRFGSYARNLLKEMAEGK